MNYILQESEKLKEPQNSKEGRQYRILFIKQCRGRCSKAQRFSAYEKQNEKKDSKNSNWASFFNIGKTYGAVSMYLNKMPHRK